MNYASVTVNITETVIDCFGNKVEVLREHGAVYYGISNEADAKKMFHNEFSQYSGLETTVKIYS